MITKYPKDTVLTQDILVKVIQQHKDEVAKRFRALDAMYKSDHNILHAEPKPKYKPDNRLVVNFAKYLVDTFNAYFIGVPVKIVSNDDGIDEYMEAFNAYNDIDNLNSEVSKMCDIFGRGYEIYYTDEESELCVAYVSPIDGFMVFDDSIIERPLWFVRLYKDNNDIEHGSVSDATGVRYFKTTGGFQWEGDWEAHAFDDVPATEFRENDEKQGLFEPVITLIDEYDKAMSEKANDVDYFADAYLKVIGAELEDSMLHKIRDDRTINVAGDGSSAVQVDFMGKPNADTTQENLISRIERLIFQISMVSNIQSESFGTSSGIALKYKLQGMSNLAKGKERKFASALSRRYKLIFDHAVSKVPEDGWKQLNFVFTQNIPSNVAEEASTARSLAGIVSKETQLSTLSIVPNVSAELERIEEETKKAQEEAIAQMYQQAEIQKDLAETTQPETEIEEEVIENE